MAELPRGGPAHCTTQLVMAGRMSPGFDPGIAQPVAHNRSGGVATAPDHRGKTAWPSPGQAWGHGPGYDGEAGSGWAGAGGTVPVPWRQTLQQAAAKTRAAAADQPAIAAQSEYDLWS